MFCEKCGSKLKEDSLFCEECGSPVTARQPQDSPQAEAPFSQTPPESYPKVQPTPQAPPSAISENPSMPEMQSQPGFTPPRAPQAPVPPPSEGPASQPPQAPYLSSQPNPQAPPYGYGQPIPKKKNSKGCLIALLIGGVVALLAIIAVVVFLLSRTADEPVQEDSSLEWNNEEAAIAPQDPAPGIDTENVALPAESDFDWFSPVLEYGVPEGAVMLTDASIAGAWKGKYLFVDMGKEGITELSSFYMYIGDRAATVNVSPYLINYGEGYQDESSMEDYSYSGAFDSGEVTVYSDYGAMDLYTFYEYGGKQYGVGVLTVQSGEHAYIGLVRP